MEYQRLFQSKSATELIGKLEYQRTVSEECQVSTTGTATVH